MFRRILKIAVLLLSLNLAVDIGAAPLACGHNGIVSSLNPLITRVRDFQPANRRITDAVAVRDGLISAKEAEEIRTALGSLVCPADVNHEGTTSTAFLLEDKDEIVTAAHAFGDVVKRRDLSKCYFQNFARPPVRKYLMAGHERNRIPYGKDVRKNNRVNDKSRLKLQSRIEDAKPLTLDDDDQPPYGGTDVIVVMAQNIDMPSHNDGPIYSPCKIMMLKVSSGGRKVASDCDSDKGGSGGVYLVRGKNGLSAKALLVELSSSLDKKKPIPNHTPYNESTNASFGLVMDKNFF